MSGLLGIDLAAPVCQAPINGHRRCNPTFDRVGEVLPRDISEGFVRGLSDGLEIFAPPSDMGACGGTFATIVALVLIGIVESSDKLLSHISTTLDASDYSLFLIVQIRGYSGGFSVDLHEVFHPGGSFSVPFRLSPGPGGRHVDLFLEVLVRHVEDVDSFFSELPNIEICQWQVRSKR